MPNTQLTVTPIPIADLTGKPVTDPDNPLLAKTVTLSAELAPKSRKSKLPVLRELRNIYGDSVLEIIPQDIRDAVDAVYQFNKLNPDVFQSTPFDSAEDRNEAVTVMRAYADMAWDYGYTIYTKDAIEPNILVWKVTDRRGAKNRSE